MNSFEQRYRDLRRSGQSGWAGENHARSVAKDRERLEELASSGIFSTPRERAIELGCGNGVAMLGLQEIGFEAFGLDISETAVNWARERFPDAANRIVCGSVTHMPFSDGFFDLAYDGACFHCLIGSDRWLALAEIRRTLRAGGVFVLSSMCGIPRKLPAGQNFDAERQLILSEVGAPLRTIRPREELECEIVAAGFQAISWSVNKNPWWDHLSLVARRT